MKLLNAGLCVFFLVFATLRADRVPLTYDEAASYIRYIDTSVPSAFDTGPLSIFNFEVATNHFLNTVLTRAFYLIAGGREIVLRLPNLIGYAMFMGFSLLILQRWARPVIATAGFLLLNLNPYVLDFFTLSRGYGISLGFLMGSLYYVLKCVDQVLEGGSACRDTRWVFLFAGAAVMANFALLNVYISILGVLLLGCVLQNTGGRIPDPGRIPDAESRTPTISPRIWRSFIPLALVATCFAALVFSQDPGLSPALYEPVAVTIAGLQSVQRERVAVIRVDLRGRESRLTLDQASQVWRRPDRVPYRGLRIELPLQEGRSIERIDVTIGNRVFSTDPSRERGWTVHDENRIRVLDAGAPLALARSRVKRFHAVMNWAGDSQYVARLAIATAWTLGALAALAIFLKLAGSIVTRRNVLTADQWRPFELPPLWIAALAGPPLYLLRRNSELYFGGTRGLVADTFYSTIDSSFYGRTYHPAQNHLVFVFILITLATFAVVFFLSARQRGAAAVRPASAVLAVIVLTSVALVVERAVFHTVFLVGRTALFYIPIYVLFATLLCEAIIGFGRHGAMIAAALLFVGLFCSTYHFATTANMKYALDWRGDASTRLMFDDLEQILESTSIRQSSVTLGVDSAYIPVTEYYARRRSRGRVRVVPLPFPQAVDFEYLEAKDVSSMTILRRYPLTGTVLVRPLPRRNRPGAVRRNLNRLRIQVRRLSVGRNDENHTHPCRAHVRSRGRAGVRIGVFVRACHRAGSSGSRGGVLGRLGRLCRRWGRQRGNGWRSDSLVRVASRQRRAGGPLH